MPTLEPQQKLVKSISKMSNVPKTADEDLNNRLEQIRAECLKKYRIGRRAAFERISKARYKKMMEKKVSDDSIRCWNNIRLYGSIMFGTIAAACYMNVNELSVSKVGGLVMGAASAGLLASCVNAAINRKYDVGGMPTFNDAEILAHLFQADIF